MTDKPDLATHTKNICNAAREYIDLGWSCFPLSIENRTPIAKWKHYQSELPTPEDIDEWEDKGAPQTSAETGELCGRHGSFNIALVTGHLSGFVVVDCDSPEAVEFAKSRGLSSPVFVKTRRGTHFYFKHPRNGARFQNQIGSRPGSHWFDCPGLDFRGDGGYVVAPPSISIESTGELRHRYEWGRESGVDLDDMPVWKGTHDHLDMNIEFDLSTLSLAESEIGDGYMDVEEQIKKTTLHIGRKLSGPDQGDSTDQWMIRYCGQMVRRGMSGAALWASIQEFHDKYFVFTKSAHELEKWLKTKARSALDMDRRNYPADYDPITGARLTPAAVSAAPANELVVQLAPLQPIFSKDFPRLLAGLGDSVYYADPILPSRSIVQVIGYNGHGKSLFVGSLTTALAAGKERFGPFAIKKRASVAYFDFDNPGRTVINRFSNFIKAHGDPGEKLQLWTPALIPASSGGEMNLRTEAGLDTFQRWLEMMKPEVVVLDTVRNAFGGLDEKSPQEWFLVNRVAKIVRDKFGATVVLVHHRNKPNEQGLGRESGSTAQLTDLDTQVIITQVFKEKLVARSKAGLFDEDLMISRGGETHSPYGYFSAKMQRMGLLLTHRVRTVTEVSFGKVREQTDLHATQYLAWCEDVSSGAPLLLHTPSMEEDAKSLELLGIPTSEIAQRLFVPKGEIERWLK